MLLLVLFSNRLSVAFLIATCLAQPASIVAREPARRPWITELFVQARNSFSITQPAAGVKCRNDFATYEAHLVNQTVWAVRMLESAEWPTMGLLAGITTHLGNWAECLQAHGGGVSGQYCLVRTRLDYTFHRQDGGRAPPELASAWQLMQKLENSPIHLSRLKLSWALCVPASCAIDDVRRSLDATLVPLFAKHGLDVAVHLEPNLCSTAADGRSTPLALQLARLLVATLFAIVVSATVLYTLKGQKADEERFTFLQSLTLEYNFKRLTSTTLPARYNVIYMAKVFGSVLVMGGHIVLIETQSAMFQAEEFEKCFAALDSCVDLYSVLSGFLIFHLNIQAAKKRGLFFVGLKVASIWIKLSALVFVHIMFAITIWPYVDDGPLWKQRIFVEAEKCQQNWWMNMLAIANLFPHERMCLLHTWYLNVNVQLSVLGGILLLAFAKAEILGVMLAIAAFLAAVLRTSVTVHNGGYNSIFLGYIKTLNNLHNEKDFQLYMATSTRVGPYLLGILAAFIAQKLLERKFVFSKFLILKIVSSSSAIALLFAYYRKLFNEEGRRYDVFEHSIYASLSRSFLILPVACCLCIYFTSAYSSKIVFNAICQNKIWLFFGRLTPNVYLIHYPLLLSVAMSRRTYSPIRNEIDGFFHWAAVSYYSFLMAFVWFLFIESPLGNIITCILRSVVRHYKLERFSCFKPTSSKREEKIE